MATLILRDTYRALIEEMESLDKQKRETSLKAGYIPRIDRGNGIS